jgi:NAD-dependent deacetylase sirtuin 4
MTDVGSSETFPDGVRRLAELLQGRRVLLLSGAGISTESGIPDYRGPGFRARPVRPIMYREFIASQEARDRYWSGSLLGWPRIVGAMPNPGHRAVARMEAAGALSGVVTQNVDGLHQAAGSRVVVELHGSLATVSCMGCGTVVGRAELQLRMLRQNATWAAAGADMAPDGHASVDPSLLPSFVVPVCAVCGGVLKPDVVFFGENVPADRVREAFRLLDAAEVLLVAGSSLTVYSGFRFVERAARDGKPVAIVNTGCTRGDRLAAVRLDCPLGQALPLLVEALL